MRGVRGTPTALSQNASRAGQLRRGALAKLDIVEPALRAMDERVFRLTAAATRGLVLLDSGDRSGAIDVDVAEPAAETSDLSFMQQEVTG
jgi:hypothetical protein